WPTCSCGWPRSPRPEPESSARSISTRCSCWSTDEAPSRSTGSWSSHDPPALRKDPMAYETILYEKSGPVVTVTLNRPDSVNALNPQMVKELHEALDE